MSISISGAVESDGRVVTPSHGRGGTISPGELELAQATFNEAAAYGAIVAMAKQVASKLCRELDALDVCCATGLAGQQVARACLLRSLTLVDIDPTPLGVARVKNFGPLRQATILCEDGVFHTCKSRYDLIVANSAYHHIEDNRKVAFLRRLNTLLRNSGRLIIGDHFLPPHGPGEDEMDRALQAFYAPLIEELRERRAPKEAVAVINKALKLGLRRSIEFKVSWGRFEHDLEEAALAVEEIATIWSPGRDECGTRVVLLRKGRP